MISRLITVAAISMVVFGSCSKSASSGSNNTGGSAIAAALMRSMWEREFDPNTGALLEQRLYTYSYNKANNSVTQYEYDTMGSLIIADTTVFTLAGHTINSQHSNPGRSDTYFINSQSNLPDSFYNAYSSTKYIYIYTYTFNANNQVETMTRKVHAGTRL